jgi:hypothetical protein
MASLMLNGKRGISAQAARALAEYFKVDAGLLVWARNTYSTADPERRKVTVDGLRRWSSAVMDPPLRRCGWRRTAVLMQHIPASRYDACYEIWHSPDSGVFDLRIRRQCAGDMDPDDGGFS